MFGETDETVNRRAKAVLAHGMAPIVCVGETLEERDAGRTEEVVVTQVQAGLDGIEKDALGGSAIAYEPVWAIGTGLTPTAEDVARVHRSIRGALEGRFGAEGAQMRILYGGSVKPSNARELLSIDNVNGALVGGASLKAADFLGIISAYEA